MGYDMYWVHIPEDLVERERQVNATYDCNDPAYKALQARNLAHRAEQLAAGEVPKNPFDESANLPEFNEWWAKRYAEEADIGTYFRLNIRAMGRYCQIMDRLGMLNDSTHSPFPNPQDYGFDDWDAIEDADPDDPNRVNYDEAHAKAVGSYVEGEGIAAYKFGSNDGWHVQPEEIISALKTYDEFCHHNATLRDSGPFKTTDENAYWQKWTRFLRRSADLGNGFKVN